MTDPLFAARAVHFASTTMVAGALCFAFFVFDPALHKEGGSAPAGPPLRRLLAWMVWSGLAVAIASGAAWLILFSGEIGGGSLSATVAGTVLTQTQFGRTWQLRGALAALLVIVLALERRGARPSRAVGGIKVALAAVLIGTLAWGGHGGADEGMGGAVHLVADIMHLLAAAAWVGALIPLAFLFAAAWGSRNATDVAVTLVATRRFSTLGVICVGTLLVTGIINTWFLAGSIPALVGTDYGRLLLVKIALFLAMVCIAAVNRMNLTARLAPGPTSESRVALRQLARNSVAEATLGFLILVIVGKLGTIPPGDHLQPSWPFALRFDASVLSRPIDRAAIAFAVIGFAAGTALIIAGALLRRWRWRMVLVGLPVIITSLAALGRATVPAFPTSYYRSPTGYAAPSITLGHTLYDQHCAACHGADGRGGSAEPHEGTMRANLTADHIYAHTDGDLFWWITHGIDQAMPGFGSVIDDNGRWNLIDFIRANADGVRLRAGINGSGYPVPDFSADCPDGTSVTPSDLHGRLVHLIIAGAHPLARLQQQAPATHIAHDLVSVVIAPEDSPPPATQFCVAQDDSVLAAFAVYRGKTPAESEGTELLIDAAGQMRAMWYPGLEPAWTDVDVLRREIAAIREPAAATRAVSHAHPH